MKATAPLVLLAGLAIVSSASAQDSREGWAIQFRQDTFDQTTYPLAMASQSGDGFDKAILAFACNGPGSIVSFFQPERLLMFTETSRAQFRGAGETAELVFSVGDVPNLGRRLVASEADTNRLKAMFEAASGADIPFRTDKKQGTFTSVGALEALAIMRSHC